MQVPDDTPLAEKVPKAGASCDTCMWLDRDTILCRNAFYIKNNDGSGQLGAKPKRWCCVVWAPENGR